MTVNRHERQKSTGHNSVLPQLAVTCKIEAECSYQTFVQVDNKVLRNRQLRQHANRLCAIKQDSAMSIYNNKIMFNFKF